MTGQLTTQLDWIGTVSTRARQMERDRINLQELTRLHAK